MFDSLNILGSVGEQGKRLMSYFWRPAPLPILEHQRPSDHDQWALHTSLSIDAHNQICLNIKLLLTLNTGAINAIELRIKRDPSTSVKLWVKKQLTENFNNFSELNVPSINMLMEFSPE